MAKAFAQAAVITACLFLTALIGGCSQQQQQQAKEEFFNYTLDFCAEQDCLHTFASQLKNARATVRCALYSIDGMLLSDLAALRSSAASNISIEIVVDRNSKVPEKFVQGKSGSGFVFKRNSKGIMHDKYCIIDGAEVITGSFNPTPASKGDYNNMVMINSTALASFYNNSFQRLKAGDNKKTPAAAATWEKEEQKAVILNKTPVEVHFCPEDSCLEAVKRKLRTANSSIAFAAYSFTHPEIANELILKRSEGIAVTGVMEKSTTSSKYSKHAVMAANGISVKLESSKKLMHHKFFVIDNKTVITGSFNPTENAAHRNDENIIVVENAALAQKYLDEFNRIT